MKFLSVATLLLILLLSACSDEPAKQGQSDPKTSVDKTVAKTAEPAQVADASKPAQAAKASKPAQVAKANKAAQPSTNSTSSETAPQLTLAELMPKPTADSENCVIDPVTGRVVCSTGLCAMFNGLCPPGTPMGMAKIPFEIGYNVMTSFSSSALTVVKTGLEKTDAGAMVVKKATNIWSRIKRAIDALMTDPPEEFAPIEKDHIYGTKSMDKPKITYQKAK
ncbi:MAG: hypothetical protein GY814_01555 [Gammaproteobacteria bacterium]|nr:hypothetical protein [Gammaproteobacteria bacterium]